MNIENKLELIQQIHREQEKNEYRGYGRGYSEEEVQGSWFASFRLRLLLAVLLFLCFFIMEKRGIVVEGIGCMEIIEYIGSNITFEDLRLLFV